MNKVTLSLVALATLGGTAQVQAADMTQEQKDAAIAKKKAAIDEIRKTLNAATTVVNGCADVKETYLVNLSQIAKDLNGIYDNDEVLEITADEVNTFNANIELQKSSAVTAQKPYTVKKDLTASYDVLKALYDSKYAIASKPDFKKVGPEKKAALQALNISAILTKINGYDLTKQDIVADQLAISAEINTATSEINKIVESEAKLKELETALENNDAAHASVVDAYTTAKASYDTQLSEAIAKLPSANYKDWQDDVIAKLNEQYRIIVAAKNEDQKDYEAGTSSNQAVARVNSIQKAQGAIETLVSNKVADMQKQEDAHATAQKDINDLQDILNGIKSKLTQRNLTDCDASIASVQNLIDALSADIEKQYKDHKIAGYNYNGKKTDITLATNAINDGKKHSYTDIINNYDAYKRMVGRIANAQKDLDASVAEAQKASKDNNYKPADYFAASQGVIQEGIDNLTKIVKTAFDGKTAADYEKGTVSGKLDAIAKNQAAYSANTAAAMTAYEASQKTVNDQNELLAKLKEAMKADTNVTIDGTAHGKSYQTRYDELTAEVKKITDKVAEAKTKKDVQHLAAMQAADALVVSQDVQSLIDNYKANKEAYDLANADATALVYLSKAGEMIKDNNAKLTGVTGDFGNQADAINASKADLQAELAKVQADYDKAAAEYNKVKGDAAAKPEEKINAAAKAVVILTEINDKLNDTVSPKVEALQKQATAAKENKAAYDATIVLANDDSQVKKDLLDIRDNTIMVSATGKAQDYYLNKITSLITNLSSVKAEIEQAYKDQKSKEKKDELVRKINTISTDGNVLKAAVEPNENAHKDQVKAAKDLKNTWQATYDNISSNDLSDKAADYLKDLAKELERINALNATIETVFGEGQSVAQKEAVETERKSIETAIVAVANDQKKNYDHNVDETNLKQHNNFEAVYKTANDAFTSAVNILNEFTSIKDADIKKIATVEVDYVKAHDDIYAYADKLRSLKSQEAVDYGKYVNDPTDGVDDIYNASTWVDTAIKYTENINARILQYQNEVNEKAQAKFQSTVNAAAAQVKEYEAKIADFVYAGKANAFKDVKDKVAEANMAGAVENGTIKDKKYACHIDNWMKTLKTDVTKLLAADLVAACDAEKNKLVQDVTKVYDAEKQAISAFKEIDNQTFLTDLETLKKNTIDAAIKDYEATPEFVNGTVRVKCAAYYANSSESNHSAVYAQANSLSGKNVKNVEAYNRIVSLLNNLESQVDAKLESVDQLFVAHKSNHVFSEATSIAADVDSYLDNAEVGKTTGACVANEAIVKTFVDDVLKVRIPQLQDQAIKTEIVDLGVEIDKVKEEYNQAAAIDLDKVKDYDEKINSLYATLLINSDGGSNVETSIEWRYKNGKLSFEAAKGELVAHEANIAAIYKELNVLYDLDEVKPQQAMAAVSAKVTDLDKAIKQAEEWAGYNEATRNQFSVEVEGVRSSLTEIQANINAKEQAGQILFYKDNLLFDLEQLAGNKILTDGKLKAEYDKQKTNDDVNTKLTDQLEATSNALTAAYDRIKDFKHRSTVIVNQQTQDAIEYWKAEVASDLASLKSTIATQYAAVMLTVNDTYAVEFVNINNKIKVGEVTAKKYEANGELSDLNTSAYGTYGYMNSLDPKYHYAPDTETSLNDQYRAIINKIQNAQDYNNNAATLATNPNYVYYNDIDGKVAYDKDGNEISVQDDYLQVSWNKIVERIAEIKTLAETFDNDAKTKYFREGDADANGKVNVNDYSEVRTWILEATDYENVNPIKRYAADMDGDKEFTVADLTQISNIIFHGDKNYSEGETTRARISSRGSLDANSLTVNVESEETNVFGKTVKLAVNIASQETFTAGQFDVKLPTGMKLVGQELTSRANGHELYCNQIGEDQYRILTSTIDNMAFNGNSGAIVELSVEVGSGYNGGAIEIVNGVFSDAQGRAYKIGTRGIDGGNGDTTGIDSITAPTVKERIYSIGGMVKKTVQKGINIIVGEDGHARKVIKK